MARIDGEVFVRRPIEEVFDFVADERNEPLYNPMMSRSEKMTEGPIGVGTRFVATMDARPRPLRMDVRYTAFDRPRLIGSTSRTGPARFTGTLTFAPTAGGTRMRWSWAAHFGGPLRLLSPLLVRVGTRREHGTWSRMRDHLEAGDPALPADEGEAVHRAGAGR